MSNPVVIENQNTGTTAWKITHVSNTQVHGYANATSVNAGGSLTLYISTQNAGTTYSIKVFRLGYYQGLGACLKLTVSGQVGVAQGYWDNVGATLYNCPTAFVDGTTGLLEARFASSYTLNIPNTWITGVYLILLTDVNGYQSYINFIVKGNPTADYVVSSPDMTEQAYNNWGGKSLYNSNSTGGVAAVKDSFDRPLTRSDIGQFMSGASINFVKWAESQGYNLSYISDIDLHVTPSLLLGYKAYISMGHDEYWTREQRDGVEAARDNAGVGLAFLGGNGCYWQMRLESGGQNGANRTCVCYRSAATDPQTGVDNTRVTVNWRAAPVNRPESSMMGIMYSHINNGTNVAWTVDPAASSSFLTGTGLVNGTSYGTDIVGQECDKVQNGSPANIQIIGTSTYTASDSTMDVSNTTVYVASSNALVFAAGSIDWAWCLDTYRNGAAGTPPIPGMQAMMANIMTALIQRIYRASAFQL
jgi:hypothetical protein